MSIIDIGRRVVLAAADETCPRHSEASIVVDEHGVLLAWSAFSVAHATPPGTEGDSAIAREWALSLDNNPAEIKMMRSNDYGGTWSDAWTAVGNNAGINVMQPALQQSAGELVMTFSRRDGPRHATRMITRSVDGGRTWSLPRSLIRRRGYLTSAHDRLVVLRSGRWVQPANVLEGNVVHTTVLFSDDEGGTWTQSSRIETHDGIPGHVRGAWEASIAERVDGDLFMAMRTATGQVYYSLSSDQGGSWALPASLGIRAPSAPSLVREVGQDFFVLFRNDSFDPAHPMLGVRRPLVANFSRDGGESWGASAIVDDSPQLDHQYASCAVDGTNLLVTYSRTDPRTSHWDLVFRRVRIV